MDVKKALKILEEFTVERRGESFYTTGARFVVIYRKTSGIRRIELTCNEIPLKAIHSLKDLSHYVHKYSRPLKKIKRRDENT